MKYKGQIDLKGNVKIIVHKPDGSQECIELANTYTNGWLNAIRNAWKNAGLADLQIKYMAWGSDNTAESAAHTKLIAEFGRKQITSQADGLDGELETTVYISPEEGNESTIEELGWFGGEDATGTKDSGIMVARVLYSRAKTNLESLDIVRTDRMEEV
jgi:hypothetical protein